MTHRSLLRLKIVDKFAELVDSVLEISTAFFQLEDSPLLGMDLGILDIYGV